MDYKIATAVIINNSKEEILFLNRLHTPLGYGLPGGKVEETDKSIKEACIRELFEETGIKMTEDDLFFYKIRKSVNDIPVHIFKCYKIIEEKDIILSTEHSSFIFTKDFDNINLAGNTKRFIL
jgi:ADP-ribose pyrophosphatase YjhB (NUDIX family)